MNIIKLRITWMMIMAVVVSFSIEGQNWISKENPGYIIHYTGTDVQSITEYKELFENGINSINEFFGGPFKSDFSIYVHPNRSSLDSTWQKDWGMPEFKSECWMVASGVASKLDIISPKSWDKESCEHHFGESLKTQQLITHELVHVYHGQRNPSPDFNDVKGIDWFVEGLAVYASGQCDSTRMAGVKLVVMENKIPQKLENFWSGKLKYGLSGSMVMFIDLKYGREKLNDLLQFANLNDLLDSLSTTEENLLKEWKDFLQN
jgi:hypothetical protein